VSATEIAEFEEPAQVPVTLSRVVSGGSSSIDGELSTEGGVILTNAAGVGFNQLIPTLTLVGAPPTLEELNIRAPEGALVAIDDDGLLSVQSSGDIYLEGPIPELPGVTGIRIVASGDIIASLDFEVPSGMPLELNAAAGIEIPGGFEPPIITPGCDPSLHGLRPIFPAERTELATFSMIASIAAQTVEIDVLPGQSPNRLRLGARRAVRVGLFGSEDLDVSEVDRSSLRLGPAQAAPRTFFGHSMVFRRDLNRDGHPDLLAVFKLRELGIAYGDSHLCLTAETHNGVALAGCDAIDTMPSWPRRSLRRRGSESSRGAFRRAR